MKAETPAPDTALVLEFMFRLGQSYLACNEQTAEVEQRLRRTGAAYGMSSVRILALPTAVFITVHDGVKEHVTLAEGPTHTLRLDQIADVYALGAAAQRAAVTPRQGLDQLAAILRKTARFGRLGAVVGHTILTVGLAMVLTPALEDLGAAAVLGAVVGAAKVLNQRRAILAVPMPVLAAALVSVLVFYGVRRGLPVDALPLLVPPLVTFLPGAMLALGMTELAYGDMVSGASRLTTGFVQLVLLAFGLAAGAALVGVGAHDLLTPTAPVVEVRWAAWAGVVVFGLGIYLHFSAPTRALPWIFLVLLLAFAVQRLAGGVFGVETSGFFGMLVATPLAYLIQLRLKGPPAMVTFLPSFWLVVPGALGLLSVTRMLSDQAAGLEGVVSVIFTIASIALGTLVGASLFKGLNEQLERAGSYLQRRRKP